MLSFARRSAAVVAVLLTSLVAASPALAADRPAAPAVSSSPSPSGHTGYACLDQEEGYAPSGVCQLVVVKAVAVCRDGAPWLDYAVKPEGSPNTTTTIVWGDASGPHSITQADLPLTGSILWPGVVRDAQGNVTDWPGWRLVNGQWVQGDEFSWARPTVAVTFHVTPQATVTVAYPPDQAPCANPPTAVVLADDTATGGSAVLAATGSSDAEPLMLVGLGVLLLGGILLTVRALLRRRDTAR